MITSRFRSGPHNSMFSFVGSTCTAFFSSAPVPSRCARTPRRCRTIVGPFASATPAVSEMSLPESLATMVQKFAAVPDVKLRYQQLLFFAKELPPMDDSLKTDENLVRGCQSVVHIFVSIEDGRVHLQADSDAQLTKGLVALLVRGFDGATPAQVLDADPQFLTASGLAAALTPARNNGFGSALALVKQKVRDLMSDTSGASNEVDDNLGPIYKSIVKKLASLEPSAVDVVDESHQHAGHAAVGRGPVESHFHIKIVSDVFDEMSLVARHRMIYDLLEEEMAPGKVHALRIEARSPAEVQR